MLTLVFSSLLHNLIILPVLFILLHHLIATLLWETSRGNLPCLNAFSQRWMPPQKDTSGQQQLHTKHFICWGLYILTFPGFCLLKMKRLLKKLVPATHPSAKWWQSSGTPSSRGWTYPQLQQTEEFKNTYYCINISAGVPCYKHLPQCYLLFSPSSWALEMRVSLPFKTPPCQKQHFCAPFYKCPPSPVAAKEQEFQPFAFLA